MSGIAGVVRPGGVVAASELEGMLQTLARRGPDRQTLSCHGAAGFGHALLATTREALAAPQPWLHPESGCLVVSDSRLDNRPQLLRVLGIHRPADSVGDGELLHAAWQRWREGCADQLRGDFAFAIWDPGEGELYLARDPMGVRPLLFHFDPGRLFVFGSTAEAVLAQGDVPDTLDEGRIADALIGETEGIDNVCTFHSSIQRLPPAHWMRLRDGRMVQQRYWRPVGTDQPSGLPSTEQAWIEAQRDRLDIAVRQRLRSHRPVGSMLSGGLDSSSVVALASRAGAESGLPPLPVFSAINSADPGCAETQAIRAVAASTACTPTYVDLPDFLRGDTRTHRLWDEAGEPFDGSMTLVAALYEAAADQSVVSVMDGVPADNLYTIGRKAQHLYDRGQVREAWSVALAQWQFPNVRFPRLRAMQVMAGCAAPATVHAVRTLLTDMSRYRGARAASLASAELARRTNLWQRYRRYRQSIGGSHHWHDSGEAMSSMESPYITAGLERYNRVAALYGVEPRVPYADRELIEFMAWMPTNLRMRAGSAKWVLRQAMSGLLPAQVAWRRDKSHIGHAFNHVLLQRGLAADRSRDHVGWLDARRLARPPRHLGLYRDGMQSALCLLSWSQRTQHSNHA